MKRIFFALFILIGLHGLSQTPSGSGKLITVHVKGPLIVDSILTPPQDTLHAAGLGSFAFKNGLYYGKFASAWVALHQAVAV